MYHGGTMIHTSAKKTKRFKRYTKCKYSLDIHDTAELLGTTPRYANVLIQKHKLCEPTDDPVTQVRKLFQFMLERGQV
jgi:hypothetical protein